MAKVLTSAAVQALLGKMVFGTPVTITAATNASSGDASVTAAGATLTVGDAIAIYSVGGATQLNGVWFVNAAADADNFKVTATLGGSALQGDNGTYTSGGKVVKISSGLTPGDLDDLEAALNTRKNEVLADKDRASERTIKTVFGL